jgi:peptide/nickel transport system permease protein
LPNVVGVIVVTFLLTRALPGDPAAYFAGPSATQEAIEQIRAQLGLDKSLVQQFLGYVVDLAKGDLGNSLSTGQPVITELATRLPASLELTLCGLIFALVVSIPLGILAATRPGSWIDHLCRILATAGVSLPTFFTGLFLAYFFYFVLGWSPSPLGRLDVAFSPPPTVTGFYLIDSLIAGDLETFRAAAAQLILRYGSVSEVFDRDHLEGMPRPGGVEQVARKHRVDGGASQCHAVAGEQDDVGLEIVPDLVDTWILEDGGQLA